MIDTIGLESPYITEEIASVIERECVRREGIDCRTGEVIYRFTTGTLEGSYDSRIRVVIERHRWVKGVRDKTPARIDTDPYLKIEGSIHKLLMGHNVHSGPTDFYASCCYFIDFIETSFDVSFDFSFDDWFVYRVDYAEVFQLGNDAVQEFMKGMNIASYPRRKVIRYGAETLFAPGSTTALRFYHKGPEFWKHDCKRLRAIHVSENYICELIDLSYSLLRVEVEVKSRKLKFDFQELPKIFQVTDDYLYTIYKKEVGRIMKEGKSERELVSNCSDVKKRLGEVYNPSLANLLLGTWYRLSIFGEEEVRASLPKSTWQRHRKQIIDAGVSWLQSDVAIVKNKKPIILDDFIPFRDDCRCLKMKSVEVVNALKRFEKAA